MPKERTRANRSRTHTALVAGGISLLLALIVAWPVYTEVTTRSAFLAGELQISNGTAVRTEVAGAPMSHQTQTIEFDVVLSGGARYSALVNWHKLSPDNGETVQVGMLGDELVSVNGYDVRGVFPFGYFALLMVLTGMTVLTAVMVISRRTKVSEELLPGTTFFAWPAAWLFLPVALAFDVGFESPWWPLIAWGGSAGLLLAIYTVKYVRLHRRASAGQLSRAS